MTVLAFDTATSSCAITLWRDGSVVAEVRKELARGHAEALVPMIEDLLAEGDLDYSDLELLAVTTGPGAFTGIRIGLATARSLALASGLPLIGVSNFEALLHQVPMEQREGRNVLTVLETKRADFYACLYDDQNHSIGEAAAVDSSKLRKMVELAPALIVGDAVERAIDALGDCDADILGRPDIKNVETSIVAELAYRQLKSGTPHAAPMPLYLKPPDVNMSGVKPLTRRLNV